MSKLLNCLINKDFSYVPIWFMRQAGRYLPEFRNLRKENPDFLSLCFNSEMASKITLQPLKRYDLDAAIIFSDILVVPYALKQEVIFQTSKTPLINNFNLDTLLNTKTNEFSSKLKPVYDAIKITRKALDRNKSLIAFVGAPWTLLIYLLNLKLNNKLQYEIVNKKREYIKLILKKLDEVLKQHILNQIEAGADTIQIFDSWAGLIKPNDMEEYCYRPNQSLVNFCKQNNIPTICFPKGIKEKYKTFVNLVRPNGISIDYDIDPNWASINLKDYCIQGGMDPVLLIKDEKLVLKEVDKYLNLFENNSYIFNLGHGILPQTNPEIIKKIVERVRR